MTFCVRLGAPHLWTLQRLRTPARIWRRRLAIMCACRICRDRKRESASHCDKGHQWLGLAESPRHAKAGKAAALEVELLEHSVRHCNVKFSILLKRFVRRKDLISRCCLCRAICTTYGAGRVRGIDSACTRLFRIHQNFFKKPFALPNSAIASTFGSNCG